MADTRDDPEATDSDEAGGWLEADIKPSQLAQIWIALLGLIVGVAVAYIYWGQLNQMIKATGAAVESANAAKRAADVAAEQLEEAERPWVTLTPTQVGPLFFDPNGLNIKMLIVLSNTGHSPAINVQINPEIYLGGANKPDPIIERDRICQQMIDSRSRIGQTIFPGPTAPQQISFGTTQAEVERTSNESFGALPAWAIICAGYSPTFIKDKRYVTGFIYSIESLDPQTGRPRTPLRRAIGPSLKILLAESPFAGVLTK